jgi:uncharacterized protein
MLLSRNGVKKFLTVFALLLVVGMTGCSGQQDGNAMSGSALQPGEWMFRGHLGNYIDNISQARILDKASWDTFYPETEEAFQLREDDSAYPKKGAWRGEFWGKYILSTIAAAKYYQSEELKTRIADATDGLLAHMEPNGYLGTYTHSEFLVGNNWNVWCRKYTLWGLVESWQLLGDKKILDAAQKLTDHLMSETGPGVIDIVTTGNFYGMPSMSILQPLVMLYNATNETRYLDYAQYIVGQWTQHPEGVPDFLNKGLAGTPIHNWFQSTNPYKWAKGYEFMSCVEGLVELYKITRTPEYLEAARNIHAALVEYERTPVGSVSFNDKFVGSAGLINTVAEICDAVYYNRLSYELFKLTGDEKYIDEIERTLYNSMLCAFNTEGTWSLRRLRTAQVHVPAQNHILQNHQCCTDNLPRGLFQAAEVAFMKKDDQNVFMCLFNEGKGVVSLGNDEIRFRTEGDFLEQSSARTIVSLNGSRDFQLNIRMPRWSRRTVVKVNDQEITGAITENWMAVEREWADGDVIEILFDLDLRWETFQPEKFDDTFHDIDFYIKEWAKMKFAGGTNEAKNQLYKHVVALDENTALPQQRALTFTYGPLALSRDIRITDGDIFASIREPKNASVVSITSIPAPANIWKLYEIDLGNGVVNRFCDFSSAGNTWDEQSTFNTWCLVDK